MVCGNLSMHVVTLRLLGVIGLTTIHAAHGGGRDKRYRLQVVALQTGLLQGLAQGQPAHQRRSCMPDIISHAHQLVHLVIAQLNLTNGQLIVTGV